MVLAEPCAAAEPLRPQHSDALLIRLANLQSNAIFFSLFFFSLMAAINNHLLSHCDEGCNDYR